MKKVKFYIKQKQMQWGILNLINYHTIKNIYLHLMYKTLRLRVSKISEKGKYKFEIIPSDANVMSLMTVEDQPIRIDVKGRLIADNPEKTPISSVKFLL